MSSYTQSLTQMVLTAPIHAHLNLHLASQHQTPPSNAPTAHTTFTTGPQHLVTTGSVHGGVSSLLLDTTCYLALIPSLFEGQAAATVASSFQILDFVIGEGKVYEVEARMIRRGKRLAFCEGEVKCEGKVVVRGSLTKVITAIDRQVKKSLAKL